MKAKFLNILKNAQKFILPPPVLTPSEWVKANLIFPDGPKAGRPMTLYSFQEGMIDVINEKKRKIVLMTSAQVGKTTILNGILFFKTANNPGNAGVLQATGKETSQWLAGKIRPMIDASPEMQKYITDKNDRNAVNNTSQVQLRNGGFWYFMSLNSPSHLRGKTLPLMLLDEVDAVETESDEGNPIIIAEQRATTFGEDARIVICSTPTGKSGAINKEYEASDKRKFHVPCPDCGHSHEMIWENVKFDWKTVEGKQVPDPTTAKYQCPECDHAFTEGDRLRAVKNGEWVVTNPDSNVAGFHINRLYSPMSTIKSVVEDYSAAFQTFSLSTFYNTALGIPYDSLNEDVELSAIDKLKTDIGIENIPDDVLFLTAGIDQQQDRLEITTMGHAQDKVYVLDHRSFYDINVNVLESKAYRELLAFLKAPFKTVSGRRVPMARANIDSGNGQATKTVYRFSSTWANIKSIKGHNQVDAPYIPVKITKTGGYELYMLGVNQGKNIVRELINRNTKLNVHKSETLEISDSVPDDYNEQLMSEELKRSGNTVRWEKKQGVSRNETLDCFVYAYAARRQVADEIKWHEWRKMANKNQPINKVTEQPLNYAHDVLKEKVAETTPSTNKSYSKPVSRPKSVRRRGWL